MKTKHTPGPWYYVNYADTYMLQDGPYYEDNNVLSCDELFGVIDKETAETNAKLSAAAPEMLEALETIKSMCDGNKDNENNIWHIANKAIKKATE